MIYIAELSSFGYIPCKLTYLSFKRIKMGEEYQNRFWMRKVGEQDIYLRNIYKSTSSLFQ